MNDMKLGRLYIQNFKCFEYCYEIDMRNKSLIVLDGPNGFGKTSFFDAIELCLYGEIRRIKATDNKNKKEYLLKNKNDQPLYIALEVLNPDGSIIGVIVVHVKAETNIGRDNKTNDYRVLINRSYMNNWPSEPISNYLDSVITDKGFIEDTTNTLQQLIESKDFKDLYHSKHYIQQDDTLHFLKFDEKERAKKLNDLFRIPDHITTNEKKLIKEKDRLRESNDVLINNQKQISKDYKNVSYLDKDNQPLIKLVSFLDNIKNNKIPNINEQLKEYEDKLKQVLWIQINLEDYGQLKHQYNLNSIIKKDNIIKNLIQWGYLSSYDDYKDINTRVQQHNRLSLIHKTIVELADKKQFDVRYLKSIKQIELHFSDLYTNAKPKIERYQELQNDLNQTHQQIKVIISLRKDLQDAIDDYCKNKNHDLSEQQCVYCGHHYGATLELKKAYEDQTKRLLSLADERTYELDRLYQHLEQSTFKPARDKARITLQELDTQSELMAVLKSKGLDLTEQDFKDLQKTQMYLEDHQIDILKYCNNNDYDCKEIEFCLINIKNELAIKRDLIQIESESNIESLNNALKKYDIYFDSNLKQLTHKKHKLDTITIECSLNELQLFKNKSYQEITNRIDAQIIEIEKIENCISIYRKAKEEHMKHVCEQLKIPFYIYSSKILQTRLEGTGIFLETAPSDNRANSYIRFTPNSTTSHDALNTMSSGQLAGVVLSLMLSMNKVYSSNFKTLLIDDPVQCMDEINMASLVDVLKNDFIEHQLIISTHEAKVSNYFRYKYEHQGKQVKTVNFQKLRYET